MADDRKIHNKCLRSERIGAMNDFQFRVWMTYELAADDCGIMPMTAIAIQNANHALEKRPGRTIMAALAHFVSVRLVMSFLHQGRAWLCQHDWQDFQKIRFPRESHFPFPTEDVLANVTAQTRYLYGLRRDARAERERSENGASAEKKAQPTHAGGIAKPLTPNQKPLTEVLSEPEESARETTTVAPIWRKREGNPPALLGGGSSGHLHCFDAPGACARGWCIPHFLGQNFVTQAGAGDYAAGVLHVAAFVAHTLATTLEGPIGDPLPFWRGKWHLAHGAAIAKPVAGKGISTLEAAQRVAAKRIAREEGR